MDRNIFKLIVNRISDDNINKFYIKTILYPCPQFDLLNFDTLIHHM